MKIIAINGSPHKKGNTYIAIRRIADILEKEGIETKIVDVGDNFHSGCVACGRCRTNGNRCIFNDSVNSVLEKMEDAAGMIIGSPTYYAGMNGTLKCFLDRLFMAGSPIFRHKVGVGVVAVRRAGALTVFDQINKYFSICEMITIGGNYWNMVFGAKEGECIKDDEGMQNMRVLANNMIWLLKTIEASTEKKPSAENKIKTNMIR